MTGTANTLEDNSQYRNARAPLSANGPCTPPLARSGAVRPGELCASPFSRSDLPRQTLSSPFTAPTLHRESDASDRQTPLETRSTKSAGGYGKPLAYLTCIGLLFYVAYLGHIQEGLLSLILGIVLLSYVWTD